MTVKLEAVGQVYIRPLNQSHLEPVRASVIREVGTASNRLLARGRYHGAACRAWDTAAGTLPNFADEQHKVKITIGPNADYLTVVVLAQAADTVEALEVWNDTGTDRELVPGYKTSGIALLEEFVFEIDVSAYKDTEVEIHLHEHEKLIRSVAIYDSARPSLEPASDTVADATGIKRGGVVKTDTIADVVTAQRSAIAKLRKQHVAESTLGGLPLAKLSADASWRNVHKSTSSIWVDSAPGYWVAPSAAWQGNGAVKLKCKVRAEVASGEGLVRFVSQYATSTVASISTSPAWSECVLYLSIPDTWMEDWAELVQVQGKHAGAGANLTIHSIVIIEDDYRQARPIFEACETTRIAPTVANLDRVLTINGTAQVPAFFYLGADAASTWSPWGYGEPLSLQAGAPPTTGLPSPLVGQRDGVVKFNLGGYYSPSGTTFGDVAVEDIVLEYFGIPPSGVNARIMAKGDSGGSTGWVFFHVSNTLAWNAYLGGWKTAIQTAALPAGAFVHAMMFINRSEASAYGARWYVGGVWSGAGINWSGIGSLVNSSPHKLGGSAYGPGDATIGHIALWLRDAWFQEGAAGPAEWEQVAKERCARLFDRWPLKATGTAAPQVMSRASAANLHRYVSGARRYFLMGANAPRHFERTDENGVPRIAIMGEPEKTNLVLQSETLETTWSRVNLTTVSTNTANGPGGTAVLDGLVGDATSGNHQVWQSVTVTNVRHCLSAFARKGNKDFAYLDISADGVADGWAYFDLVNGICTSKGAGALAADVQNWGGGLWRIWFTMLPAAGSRGFGIYSAEADGDKTFSGDGSTVNLHVGCVQLEVGERPTSYVATTTAQVIRSGDKLRYKADDGNVTAGQGTVTFKVLSWANHAVDVARTLFSLSAAGASTDQINVAINTNGKILATSTKTGGSAGSAEGLISVLDGFVHTIRVAWQSNRLCVYTDGMGGTPDTDVGIPTGIDRIEVGMNYNENNQADIGVYDIKIYSAPEG